MRSFIAVNVNNEKVLDALNELGKVKADIKLVEPENLHLTLKFFGEIPEDAIEKIHAAMKTSLSGFKPFEVSLRGLGAFPNQNYVRVVWVGLRENKEMLIDMQSKLESELSKIGFKPEDRKFDPHLTLGRVKSPKGKDELKNFLLSNSERDFGTFSVNSIELKKSTLTPKGPIYSTVRELKL